MQNYRWLSVPWECMEYYTAYIGSRIQDKIVLDLGCSCGHETLFLALHWHPKRIIGVDNYGYEGGTPQNRETFAHNVQATGCRNLSIVQADVFSLPFEPGSIDVVICSQTLHHLYVSKRDLRLADEKFIDDATTKLRGWHAALKPGGEILIRETFRYNHPLPHLLARIGVPAFSLRVNYKKKQNPATWCWLLERAGFHVHEVTYNVPYKLRSVKPFVQKRLVNLWVNSAYLVRATARN